MRLLLPALVLILAACDSETPRAPEFGRFDAEVRGTIDRDLEGDATFRTSTVAGPDTELLTLTLSDRAERGRFVSVTDYQGALSTTGTYAVGATRLDGPSVLYADRFGDLDEVLAATGGTIRITAATGDRIEGVIEVRMQRVGRSEAAELSATFEAIRLEVPSL